VRLLDRLISCITQYSLLHGGRQKVDSNKKCQVVRVLWRSSKNMFKTATLDDYMYVHSDWVDTAFVLSSDHMTLQGVTKTHAFFCVTQPSVDVYSSSFYPFVFTNQFMLAEKLIIVNLMSFTTWRMCWVTQKYRLPFLTTWADAAQLWFAKCCVKYLTSG